MPKVKDRPPKVGRSARDDRPTPYADELEELRAENHMLRLQLQNFQVQTVQVQSTSSASFARFAPLHAVQNSSGPQMTAQTAILDDQSAIAPLLVLGATLDPITKCRILEGCYVELGGLSSPADTTLSAAVGHDGQQPSVSLTPVRANPPGNILDWLRLFATYTCVYLETHASEAPSMVSYMVKILDFHRRHGRFAWRVYDEAFRRQRAVATTATATATMPWHVTNWELALFCIDLCRLIIKDMI